MAVYRFQGEIGEDHRLTVPGDIPAGPAKVVVIPQAPDEGGWSRMQELIREMADSPHHTRTKEEIDAYLRAERESWD